MMAGSHSLRLPKRWDVRYSRRIVCYKGERQGPSDWLSRNSVEMKRTQNRAFLIQPSSVCLWHMKRIAHVPFSSNISEKPVLPRLPKKSLRFFLTSPLPNLPHVMSARKRSAMIAGNLAQKTTTQCCVSIHGICLNAKHGDLHLVGSNNDTELGLQKVGSHSDGTHMMLTCRVTELKMTQPKSKSSAGYSKRSQLI